MFSKTTPPLLQYTNIGIGKRAKWNLIFLSILLRARMLCDVVPARELALPDVVRAPELTLRDFALAKHSASHDSEKSRACF